jgi:hypothetical protein
MVRVLGTVVDSNAIPLAMTYPYAVIASFVPPLILVGGKDSGNKHTGHLFI